MKVRIKDNELKKISYRPTFGFVDDIDLNDEQHKKIHVEGRKLIIKLVLILIPHSHTFPVCRKWKAERLTGPYQD